MAAFWMPVGRWMAMLCNDRTSHGLTPRDSKLVLGYVGAVTAVAASVSEGRWLGRLLSLLTRDGALNIRDLGAGDALAESLRRFRELTPSRESECECESVSEGVILFLFVEDGRRLRIHHDLLPFFFLPPLVEAAQAGQVSQGHSRPIIIQTVN